MALLTVENLTKIFTVGKGEELIAVNNVSFVLERGETLGLVGESGSGKTTVGRCVLRLIEPTEGRIALGDQQISELDPAGLRDLRARMQLVFQDPFGSLNPRLTVYQTVDEPLALHGVGRAERRPRVGAMLERVGLSSDVFTYYPADLTASEQQRVGIARALVTEPEFVVLDEPTSMLDPSARAEILDLLKAKSRAETETAYIFISHDLTSVAKISHRIAIMYSRPYRRARAHRHHHGEPAPPLQPRVALCRAVPGPAPPPRPLRDRGRDPDGDQPEARMPALRPLSDPRRRLPGGGAADAGGGAGALFGMPALGRRRGLDGRRAS